MKKLLLLAFVGVFATPAYADFTGKDASAATITFKNPGTCSSVVCVPIFSLFDPTGTNGAAIPTAGADAQSNTANGLLTYSRNVLWNGTTWDRWMGDLTSGGWVNVKASVLPTGASTSALQTTGNTSLGTIATNSGTQATAANQATGNASLATIATNSALPLPAQSTHTVDIGAVDQISPYPAGATPITASATGTTAATTATLAGTTGKTTYICGYSIRANATAATTVTNTITGVITATLSSIMWVAPAASGLGVDEQIFSPCIPASATNTGIAIVSGAPGTGGTVSSKGWGYQL